jgi:FkbM family methyltransferase
VRNFTFTPRVGWWKLGLQRVARRFGYQVRRLDQGVDLVDPYVEQQRLLGAQARVIFEVGAADGADCLRYASLFPKARIFAFEPLPRSFAHLSSLGSPIVFAFQSAMADRVGKARFHVAGWPDSSSLLPPVDEGRTFDACHRTRDRIDVDVETIDHFCDSQGISRIDLLKMDVQGAETLVLDGARGMLERGAIGMIFTEVQFAELYAGAARFEDVAALLRRHGFRLHNLYGLRHDHCGRICWGDAIFIHDSASGG